MFVLSLTQDRKWPRTSAEGLEKPEFVADDNSEKTNPIPPEKKHLLSVNTDPVHHSRRSHEEVGRPSRRVKTS